MTACILRTQLVVCERMDGLTPCIGAGLLHFSQSHKGPGPRFFNDEMLFIISKFPASYGEASLHIGLVTLKPPKNHPAAVNRASVSCGSSTCELDPLRRLRAWCYCRQLCVQHATMSMAVNMRTTRSWRAIPVPNTALVAQATRDPGQTSVCPRDFVMPRTMITEASFI